MTPTDRDFTLGFILENPGLLDAVDIPENHFRIGHQRAVWAAILELREVGQPVNLITVASRANGCLDYLNAIPSGVYKIRPAEFQRRILAERIADIGQNIRRLAQYENADDDELAVLIEERRRLQLEAETGEHAGPHFFSRKAGGIPTRHVDWLWPGVIPFGMTAVIEGDAGVGKTFVAADIAARVTRGHAFPSYLADPDGHQPIIGSVVYITSEGVPDRILVPRLVAAGADLERVEIVEGICSKTGEFEILDLSQHLPALARRMKNDPEIKAVVIDPLASHLSPKINMNATPEMRAAMDCVARFAEEIDCAVVVVLHLNKDDRKAAIHRAAGSGQIMAAVKSAWAVVKKPDDGNDNRRYFGPVKSNLSPYRRSLAFEIQGACVHFDDGTDGEIGRVVWNLEPEEFDLQGAISPGTFELKSKVGAAVTFLRERLATGPRHVRDLLREAEALGIDKNALWKGKRREGIEDGREGFGKPSVWYYPTNREGEIQ